MLKDKHDAYQDAIKQSPSKQAIGIAYPTGERFIAKETTYGVEYYKQLSYGLPSMIRMMHLPNATIVWSPLL